MNRLRLVLILLVAGAIINTAVAMYAAYSPMPARVGAGIRAPSDFDVRPPFDDLADKFACDLWSHAAVREVFALRTTRPLGCLSCGHAVSGRAVSVCPECGGTVGHDRSGMHPLSADVLWAGMMSYYAQCADRESPESCHIGMRAFFRDAARGMVNPETDNRPMLYVESGWPFRSFVGLVFWTRANPPALADPKNHWAMHVERKVDNVIFDRAIPYMPRTVPFVVNALIYALCLVALSVFLRDLRGRLRRRRGLCRACGYDLRGAAHEQCPECGRSVRPSRGLASLG